MSAPTYALTLSADEVARYQVMAQRAADAEAEAWQRIGIRAGALVADIGCGPGALLMGMAAAVGPSGSVVGVDADPQAVRVAEQLITAAATMNATVRVGQADASGLAQGSFDVAVARHVLAHNGGRELSIVRHLADLVRPGGAVYVVDVDLTAVRLLGGEPDAVDLLQTYARFQAARGNDPQVGLRLGSLLSATGLVDVEHAGTWTLTQAPPGLRPAAWAAREAMVAEGVATPADVDRWAAALDRSDRGKERPTVFVPTFSATGRRP